LSFSNPISTQSKLSNAEPHFMQIGLAPRGLAGVT